MEVKLVNIHDFEVIDIIDGQTIRTKQSWHWDGSMGNKIRIVGYNVNTEITHHNEFAVEKLKTLLKPNTVVHLIEPIKVSDDRRLECTVKLNDVDISEYFPEFKNKHGVVTTPSVIKNVQYWFIASIILTVIVLIIRLIIILNYD